jgi:hypothetical protein
VFGFHESAMLRFRYKPRPRAATYVLLLLAVSAVAAVGDAVIASKRWEKGFVTKETADDISTLTVDLDAKYACLAGRVVGPRGSNVSFDALLRQQGHRETGNVKNPGPELYDNTRIFEDGVVVKISRDTADLVWVYRLTTDGYMDSEYTAIAFSVDGKAVYAAGYAKNPATRMRNAIITILDAESGAAAKTIAFPSTNRASFSAIAALPTSLFLCGRDSTSNAYPSIGAEGEDDSGGVVVMKLSVDGTLKWARQGGAHRLEDFCSDIAVSDDRKAVVVSATVFPANNGSKTRTGQVAVYSLDSDGGRKNWKVSIPRAKTVVDVAMGMIVDANAVYVSASKWTDKYRGNRIFVYKLSEKHGTRLWGKETCCGNLISSLADGEYEGKGSAEPAGGLFKAGDSRIYQVGYYRRRLGKERDRYATVLLRASMFGDQGNSDDVSSPVEVFKDLSDKPKVFASDSGGRLFVVENFGNVTGTDAEANNAKIVSYGFDLAPSIASSIYLATSGLYYSDISANLDPAFLSAPVNALVDIVADHMRVASSQISLSGSAPSVHMSRLESTNLITGRASNTTSAVDAALVHAFATDVTVTATIFTDNPANEAYAQEAVARMTQLVKVVSADAPSLLEGLLDVVPGTRRVKSDVKIVRQGLTAERKAGGEVDVQGTGDERSAGGLRGREIRKGGKKVAIIGGAVGGIAVFAGLIYLAVRATASRMASSPSSGSGDSAPVAV